MPGLLSNNHAAGEFWIYILGNSLMLGSTDFGMLQHPGDSTDESLFESLLAVCSNGCLFLSPCLYFHISKMKIWIQGSPEPLSGLRYLDSYEPSLPDQDCYLFCTQISRARRMPPIFQMAQSLCFSSVCLEGWWQSQQEAEVATILGNMPAQVWSSQYKSERVFSNTKVNTLMPGSVSIMGQLRGN